MIGVGPEDHPPLRTQPVLELSVETCPVLVLIVRTDATQGNLPVGHTDTSY
jgi:hypothetical protein